MGRLWPGVLALVLLASIVAGALGALLSAAPDIDLGTLADDRYLRRVVAFTFWQALLSAVLSTGLAIPVARALARREGLPGRAWLLKLVGLPLVVPSIVAVFGIVAVYGHSGWINDFASLVGAPRWQNLYGLSGILLAHVFFNLPLAVRLLLPLWSAVPGETWRLVAQLGMRSGAIWRLIEWPLLRQALPGVAGLVFMLCFTSFAVVLTLGGGPAASTVEVAIYQALRFEFDPARAVFLALLELGCCALLVGLGQRFVTAMPSEITPGRSHARPDVAGRAGRIADALLIAALSLFVALPLAAVAVAGLAGPVGKVLSDGLFWACAARSLVIALCAAPLALGLAWSLLAMCRRLRLRHSRPGWADGVELSGSLVIVVPPIVFGTGFFILLSPHMDVYTAGPPLVVLVNALMGVPYVLRGARSAAPADVGPLRAPVRKPGAARPVAPASCGSATAAPPARPRARVVRGDLGRRPRRDCAVRHPGQRHPAPAPVPEDGELPDGRGRCRRPLPHPDVPRALRHARAGGRGRA